MTLCGIELGTPFRGEGAGSVPQPPKGAAEEAEDAAGVAFGEGEAAQEKPEIVAVGGAHLRRGVTSGLHGLLHDAGKKVEGRGSDGRVYGARRGLMGWRFGCKLIEVKWLSGQFVEADSDCLAQVHGWLLGGGGDFDEQMAAGEVFAGEAALFRAEDQGDAAAAVDFTAEGGAKLGKRDDWLFGLAMGEGSSAGDEGAIGEGLGERSAFSSVFEDLWRADCRAGFAPVGRVGRGYSQTSEAEIGHGTGYSSDVEGVARRDQDDEETVALGGGEQAFSVVPGQMTGVLWT
jgi:hypothetical protein